MTLPCNRRGAEVRPGLFECPSNRLAHPEPGIVAIGTCDICPYRNMPDRVGDEGSPSPPVESPCAHRGAVIEKAVCNACGMKGQPFDVFACSKHGKCMVKRYRNDRPDLKVCAMCDDFAAK